MSLRFIHVVSVLLSSLFMVNNSPWHRQTTWCSSAYLSVHAGLFPPFGDCERCYCEHACSCFPSSCYLRSFGYILRSGIAGPYGNSVFNILRDP